MKIEVISKTKDIKSQQIQSANKLVSYFVCNENISLKDSKVGMLSLGSLLKKIQKTYTSFFKAVQNKREPLTQKLFIYLYRSICDKFGVGRSSQADEQFKAFLHSVLKYKDNHRCKLFAALIGIKSNLDTDSFQLFYDICRYFREKQ